ncbi:MAG: ABC transporter permease [Bdellovibrionota bacterium]|mgnify:CR=1 FL=1
MSSQLSNLKSVNLFLRMTVRDRYLGSALGSLWAVLSPLMLLAIYTFVFGFVLKSKAPGATTTLSYAIWLISGFGPWQATTEALLTSSHSIVSASSIIKNLPVRMESIPVAGALVGFIPLIVSIVFLLLLLPMDHQTISWHILFLIPVIVVHFSFLIALGFWLSPVTVFSRDFGLALPNLLTVALFATPIFYSIENMPAFAQKITHFNPFYIIAESYRACLVHHQIPSMFGMYYVLGLAVILMLSGLKLFKSVKGYFEAVL